MEEFPLSEPSSTASASGSTADRHFAQRRQAHDGGGAAAEAAAATEAADLRGLFRRPRCAGQRRSRPGLRQRADHQPHALLARGASFRSSHPLCRRADRAAAAHARPTARPRLRIWSAGCSTGQEPYCIAMDLLAAYPELKRWDFRILATDIDTAVLPKAETGIYPESELSGLAAERAALFERGARRLACVVPKAARRHVSFKPLNLMAPWPMQGPFDAVFCRNVTIYFDKVTQSRVFARLGAILAPGGFLYIGHSENLAGSHDGFRLVGKTIYQAIGQGRREERRMSIKVLVVDDSAVMREVLSRMLAREGDITVVGTADDPLDARVKIKELHPGRRHARHRDARHERARLPRPADAAPSAAGGDGLDADHQERERDAAGARARRRRFRRQSRRASGGGIEAFGPTLRSKVRAAAASQVGRPRAPCAGAAGSVDDGGGSRRCADRDRCIDRRGRGDPRRARRHARRLSAHLHRPAHAGRRSPRASRRGSMSSRSSKSSRPRTRCRSRSAMPMSRAATTT